MFYKQKSNLLLLLLLQFCAFSVQSQDILWEKSYGGKHAEFLYDAIPTPDYGFILAGSSISNKGGNKSDDNRGDLDYWVWKMDEGGGLDWQKSFGGSGSDLLQSIKLTTDAGFILAGTSTSNKGEYKNDNCKGNADFWVIKLDAKGGEMWQKTIGGNGLEKLQSIVRTSDGGYVLGGSSSSDKTLADKTGATDLFGKSENSRGNLDYWIVKLTAEGAIEWQKTIGGLYVDELKSIEQTNDGGYILGGYSNSPISGEKMEKNIGMNDYWIVKLNKAGAMEWQKTIGGAQDDRLSALTQTHDGGYIAAGNSNSGVSDSKTKTSVNGTDFWIVKMDFEGNILWQETYNYGDVDVLTSVVEDTDGSMLIGGYAQNNTKEEPKAKNGKKSSDKNKGIDDYIALKINAKGEEIWTQTVGSTGDDVLKKLVETRDGGYLLAGTSNPQSDEQPVNSSNSNAMGGGMVGNSMQNIQNKINTENPLAKATKDMNDGIKDQMSNATSKANNALSDATKDSGFKMGVNAPTGGFTLPSAGMGTSGDLLGDLAGKNDKDKKLPMSGDKKNNFGNSDFWVVKLRDKSKSEKTKVTIEALPNPVVTFTNVIINYEYAHGTATLYDLNGRLVQQVKLKGERTVPFDMSAMPRGVYIINISTDIEQTGIKVIKQ